MLKFKSLINLLILIIFFSGCQTVKTKTDVILEKNGDHTLEVGSGVGSVKAVAIAYSN